MSIYILPGSAYLTISEYEERLMSEYSSLIENLKFCSTDLDKLRVLSHFINSNSIFAGYGTSVGLHDTSWNDILSAHEQLIEEVKQSQGNSKEKQQIVAHMKRTYDDLRSRTEDSLSLDGDLSVDTLKETTVQTYTELLDILDQIEGQKNIDRLDSEVATKLRERLRLDASKLTFYLGLVVENSENEDRIRYSSSEVAKFNTLYQLLDCIYLVLAQFEEDLSLVFDRSSTITEGSFLRQAYQAVEDMYKVLVRKNRRKLLTSKTESIHLVLSKISEINVDSDVSQINELIQLFVEQRLLKSRPPKPYNHLKLHVPEDALVKQYKKYAEMVLSLIKELKEANDDQEINNLFIQLSEIVDEIGKFRDDYRY
jgi:HEPN domain-containing protein